uniref:Putative site-specific DNA endonuclease n=1 Tax=Tupiella akineta TaxID=160070 RepID=Q3ZJ06_TUPAK|nr:putative site-specific DNA endonuclease [Tupiella akineta]AAV80683.1 putative site-specific DNA endonuclease [Tupiella akineta]
MNNYLGSSETLREIILTQFHFKEYIEKGTPQHKPLTNTVFLEWFIGFFEAEGSFLVWPNGRSGNRFGIDITQKDPGLIYKIRTRLGFGKVVDCTKKGNLPSSTLRFYVNKRIDLERLILLFNGNLITEKKRNQFANWIHLINLQYGTTYYVLPIKQKFFFLNNAWLSGFLEGDGGFWVSDKNILRLKDGNTSLQLRMKFYITQKEELKFLQEMAVLFKITSKIGTLTNGSSDVFYNRLETSKLESHFLVLKYLEQYPFLGKRAIQLRRWSRLVKYRSQPYALTPKGLLKFIRLIKQTKPAD